MEPKRIGVIGFEGAAALDLVGPAEAFNAAVLDNGYGGRIPCYTVSLISAGSTHFRAESGLEFAARETLQSASDFDTIIIPGGRGISAISPIVAEWLLERYDETHRVGAICSGIYPLAATGLLDGRDVTTHWRFATDLARRFPRLKIDHKKPLVRDGRYFTSNGLNGGLNLALAMIQEDYGSQLAQSVGRDLTVFLKTGEQDRLAPERIEPADHSRERFAGLVSWIIRNLDSDLSVELLARRACMCPSHFSKAFKSMFGQAPSVFIENLRLHEARRRLSKRQKAVRSIAASVGFSNPVVFQRAFERRFGMLPSRCLETAQATNLTGARLASARAR